MKKAKADKNAALAVQGRKSREVLSAYVDFGWLRPLIRNDEVLSEIECHGVGGEDMASSHPSPQAVFQTVTVLLWQ
jgi:hypothetical protein